MAPPGAAPAEVGLEDGYTLSVIFSGKSELTRFQKTENETGKLKENGEEKKKKWEM